MSIVRNFNLYLNAGNGSAPYINVSQYDQGEQWVFTLYKEDGTKYTPSTGAIIGIKADNRGIINTGTVDADGRVVINETQQMTAAAGIAIFELLIDGDSHGTANFLVNVEQRPGDNADLSDSDLSLIQQAVDSAEVIVEVIGDSDPSEVIGEHVDAWLDAHPEATTTVQDGAITAPKINQSLWDKLLVSESASGAVASFDDGADDVPISSLKVALEPVQLGSGDPSPSNVRPIVASNGKNLLQVTGTAQTINGVTFTIDNGVITANGTCTANVSFEVGYTDVTGSLLINGSTSGTDSTYGLRIGHGSASTFVGRQHGADYAYTASDRVWINIYVFTGVTLNNFKFYPMIRLASITDASYQPYQGIMVDVQSGNLAHLVNETRTSLGITTVIEDEKITATGTATSTYANLNYLHPITITNGQTYTVMLSKPVAYDVVFRFATDTTDTPFQHAIIPAGNTKLTFTANNNYSFFRVWLSNISSGTVVNISDLQILVGIGDILTYEPYTSASYPYTLGQSVYGGTVDLATGVLTVTHGIDLIDGNHAMSANGSDGTTSRFILTPNPAKAIGLSGFISDKFSIGTNIFVGKMAGRLNSGNIEFYLPIDVPQTVEDGKAWFAANPTTVCYPLATPQTIQLTPTEVKTLLGYNNISSTGTVDVIYHADTKLYVDKMTAVDNAIIAPTEADFVATRNYTVNDLLIVADTLYKVTANIASGSAITPNSNVTQTTLSALIKALS